MDPQTVTVNSLRFDRSLKRSWSCELIEQSGDLIVLLGEFQNDVEHGDLGRIRAGTISREYFWLDRWFNVFVFFEPEGNLRNLYCNINLPPTYASGVLEYVDLDIDLVVWPDGSYEILDREDFKQNSLRFDYSRELMVQVDTAVAELSAMAEDQSIFRRVFAHIS